MRRWLLLLCTLALAGCGASQNGSTRASATPQPSHAPLQSARTPEGARGADRSHYVLGTPPLTLTGGEIHIDAAGLALIERFEEVYKAVYCPYWDPYGGVWTRGFGETDWGGDFGGVCITHAQAEANLHYLMEADYQYAVRDLGVSFNHHQVDALDSFVWNLGAGIFTGSLRYAIQHYDPYPMLAYDMAGGQVLPGLVERRHAEVALFLEPEGESPAARRARLEAELAAHERVLVGLRSRIVVLRRVLRVDGCDYRLEHHEHRGLRCVRWRDEGYADHLRGVREDRIIATINRELA